MKYIDAEKIRAEIERRKGQLIRGACAAQIEMETNCKDEAYNEVLAFLDTMEEEPDKSLDEAARNNADSTVVDTRIEYCGATEDVYFYTKLIDAFITGAQWQEKRNEEAIKTAEDHAFLAGADWQYQKIHGELHKIKAEAWGEGFNTHDQLVMKEAVEANVADLNGDIYNYCLEKGMTDDDKVKLIIVKEDKNESTE